MTPTVTVDFDNPSITIDSDDGAVPIHIHPIQVQVQRKVHPLLWVTMGITLLALMMVPKGSLPLTGRHRALRAQELAIQERLAVLASVSSFLPPQIAALLPPSEGLDLDINFDLARAETQWVVEDLDGAAVLRAPGKEVWVVKEGALALGKERSELEACLARERARESENEREDERDKVGERERKDDRVERSHLRDRQLELDERERHVHQREKWVLESMRKMSELARDEVHTLEQQIMLKLKDYQRQLAVMHAEQ